MAQELDGDFLSFDEDGFPSEAGPSTGTEDPSGVRRRLFNKELRCMLYGYGDDLNSYTEVVDFLEDLVLEFISELTHKALETGRVGKVQVEDIIFLVRKQPKMYARVKQLLIMNEELKKARKAFDEIKYVQGGS